ncbi:MAG: tetratricopeptide repeat protein [Candidatus Omnitrophica bacterium]|nr:tetratricopeptide repeat protein [Candidatus Omnitrophota bacterium]
MNDSSHKGYPKIIPIIFILVVFVYFSPSIVLAASELSQLQKEARANRAEGLKYQNAGDLTAAATFYQRAIEIDPFYAVAYNDLGIISEARGEPEWAKELYLKAIEIEPKFLSAYSNLALIYEQEPDLEKAAYYWKKRVELGTPDDPWTIKAKRRLEDINPVLLVDPVRELLEQETIRLSREVRAEKQLAASMSPEQQAIRLSREIQSEKFRELESDNEKDYKLLARKYFAKAKSLDKQGKALAAFKAASDANQLDPSNSEIEEFVNKVSTRMLLR